MAKRLLSLAFLFMLIPLLTNSCQQEELNEQKRPIMESNLTTPATPFPHTQTRNIRN